MTFAVLSVAPVEVAVRGDACEGADLAARIDAHLVAAGVHAEAVTTVDAELDREGALWRLRLRVPADGAVRTFRAASCATVIDAAAFVVAVAIDPAVADVIDPPASELAEEPAPIPEPAPEPAPESEPRVETPAPSNEHDDDETPSTPPAPVVREPDSPPRRVAPAFTFGVDAGIEGGALPRVGAIVRGQIGMLSARWRVDLRGHFRTPSRATVPGDRDVGGRISAWALGVRGCGLPPLPTPRLELPLCVGAEAGRALASGFGFDGAQSTRLPWVAIVAGPALAWAFRPSIALVVTAEVGASLLGGRFVIENLQTVHRVGVPFGRALVGLEGRFRGRSGA